jgi:hypothetical protein
MRRRVAHHEPEPAAGRTPSLPRARRWQASAWLEGTMNFSVAAPAGCRTDEVYRGRARFAYQCIQHVVAGGPAPGSVQNQGRPPGLQPFRSTIFPSTEPAARYSRARLASSNGNVRLTSGSIFFSATRAKILGRSSRNCCGSFRYSMVMP